MEIPTVVHPTRFEVNGVLFQVVAFGTLTDAQAELALKLFLRNNRLKKKPKRGQLVKVFWTGDIDLLGSG